MTLRLNGSTSGYVEIDAPAAAGSNTLVLPTGNGSSGQVLSTNGSGALSWVDRFSAAGPAFRAYRSGSNQSVTNNAFNKVAANAESFDTSNNFDSSTNYRFTPTVAGYYQVSGVVNIESSTGSRVRVIASIYKNGSIYARGSDVSVVDSLGSTVSDVVYLNGSTDYIELWGYISVGTTAVFTAGSEQTYFSAFLARPA